MRKVGAYQAKTRLAELLDRVEAGEHVTITRHRRPVARLVPAAHGPHGPVGEVIAAMRAFRKGRKLGKLSLRRMIEEGRR